MTEENHEPLGMEPAPIVVFGAPRSGTTYLQQLLNQHPDVFISHESRIFAWLHQAAVVLPRDDDYVVTNRDEFQHALREELPDLIRRFYRTLAPEKRYWGDKNPHYARPRHSGCLDTVLDLFPGARFVNIVRDGRDVVASLLRRRHDDGTPWVDFDGAHHTWLRHVSEGTDFGSRVGPAVCHEIRYEKLIADDVAGARQLFDFLGISFHEDVERFCETQHNSRTPFSQPTRDLEHGATRSDWTDLLEPEQRRQSLEMLGPMLDSLGYGDR